MLEIQNGAVVGLPIRDLKKSAIEYLRRYCGEIQQEARIMQYSELCHLIPSQTLASTELEKL